jgi:glycosyltransferase involved in cell wall biosynthesis
VDYADQVLDAKKRALEWLTDEQLVIVTPSQWLLDLSAQSRVTRRFRHVLIENPALIGPVNTDSRKKIRSALGLPASQKVVLFVSDNLRNPRKGMEMLFAAARLLARKGDVHFVGVGQRTDVPEDLAVTFLGRTADEETLSRYYKCADVLVHPAVAENSSLVIIEAISCGTPVVAFAAGGTPELVNERCGALAKPGDVKGLAEAMEEVLFLREFQSSELSASAGKHAVQAVWQKYKQVYMDLTA